MAYKSSSSSSKQPQSSSYWQDQLKQACYRIGIAEPQFQLVSDRRGGRTAWSCTVKVFTKELSARFWYDGKNSNNAKEDAAEVGINWLNSSSPTLPPVLRNRGW